MEVHLNEMLLLIYVVAYLCDPCSTSAFQSEFRGLCTVYACFMKYIFGGSSFYYKARLEGNVDNFRLTVNQAFYDHKAGPLFKVKKLPPSWLTCSRASLLLIRREQNVNPARLL